MELIHKIFHNRRLCTLSTGYPQFIPVDNAVIVKFFDTLPHYVKGGGVVVTGGFPYGERQEKIFSKKC